MNNKISQKKYENTINSVKQNSYTQAKTIILKIN